MCVTAAMQAAKVEAVERSVCAVAVTFRATARSRCCTRRVAVAEPGWPCRWE